MGGGAILVEILIKTIGFGVGGAGCHPDLRSHIIINNTGSNCSQKDRMYC